MLVKHLDLGGDGELDLKSFLVSPWYNKSPSLRSSAQCVRLTASGALFKTSGGNTVPGECLHWPPGEGVSGRGSQGHGALRLFVTLCHIEMQLRGESN